ncbi:MAG: aminoglycoside phosphotransferase family protein [Defluviitaleaceae bacterium]|nr:aminoglycoside phosphotransferase family protein [Defluviitaleaceae bacterium]
MLDLELIGEGATTKVYRDGGRAIKLYANPPPNEAENEAERQRFAYDAGLPVPAVYGVRKIGENAVALEMEYIDGQPLLRPGMGKDERNGAIRELVKLQRTVQAVHAAGQPSQKDRMAWKISRAPQLDERVKSNLLALLDRLDDGSECLCHGDFHPLNVLFDGTKHWIIDWVDAAAGNPLADACRTYTIFKQHMSRSAGVYLRLYCKEAKARPKDVLAWLPVVAAARLAENLDEKSRAWLMEIISRGELC